LAWVDCWQQWCQRGSFLQQPCWVNATKWRMWNNNVCHGSMTTNRCMHTVSCALM
jgi:hypothetical protein